NTSSGNGGLYPLPTTPIYAATKAAVTSISEVLRAQLEMTGSRIQASVLFPGPNIVRTNIFTAQRNRPAALPLEKEASTPPPTLEEIGAMLESVGMAFGVTEPEEAAEHAFEGIRANRFWLLPPSDHIDQRIRDRVESILKRENPRLTFF
ncbi:MAG: SDR family NAD(P)-dependent oxidoreductase, partial [Myxococcales bacterium]|nr:SDR family NAD(P)-dependent oxidoreductase [Myxococcales bacterium]